MKIDTEIRHVTKPGANLFLEWVFSPGVYDEVVNFPPVVDGKRTMPTDPAR